MNTKQRIIDLHKICEELEQSDCKGKAKAVEHIKAAVAEIEHPKSGSGAFTPETIKEAKKWNTPTEQKFTHPPHDRERRIYKR